MKVDTRDYPGDIDLQMVPTCIIFNWVNGGRQPTPTQPLPMHQDCITKMLQC